METGENPVLRDEAPSSETLRQEIARALEMMRRVRTANLVDQAGAPVDEPQGNRYVLPEPVPLMSGQIS